MSKKQLKPSVKASKGKYQGRNYKPTSATAHSTFKQKLTFSRLLFQNRIVVIAADISPIDVLSHLPILCEDKNVPYIYVKSRAEVGEACKTKRPTSCVLIAVPDKKQKVKASFDRCLELVKAKN